MGYVSSGFQSNGSGWPLSRSIDFGSNADRWAVVHVSAGGSAVCTGVTVGSDTLTLRATGSGLGGGTQYVFEGPVTGTGFQTVTANGTGASICWMSASSYDGISGYRTGSAAVDTNSFGTPALVLPTTVAGDICWAGGNDYTAGKTAVATSPATTLVANAGEWTIEQSATGTSETLACTFTGGATGAWQWGGLALIPAGGGGGGTITSEPFKNNTGTVLATTTIDNVAILDPTDGSLVLYLASQSTDTSGVLSITDAALTASTDYLLVCWSTGLTDFGCEPYTAT